MPASPDILALLRRAAGADDVIGLAGGLPAETLLPREALAHAIATTTARSGSALQYGWAEGDPRLRAWIATRLAARGADVSPDDVIVTTGAQQALVLAAGAIRGRIAVGAETYPAAIDAFAVAGAHAVVSGVRTDYAIIGVHNPRGDQRREAPGEGATIADEAYAELRFDGRVPRPLLADARSRVWHIGTISKVICPGLRVGWLVPPRSARAAVIAAKSAADLQTASLSQAALVALLDELDYEAVVSRARSTYAARAAALAEAIRAHFPEGQFTEPDGGFTIWLELDDPCPTPRDEQALLAAAVDAGTSFDPGSMFRVDGATSPLALRLSFSHCAIDALGEAVRRLAIAVARWRART